MREFLILIGIAPVVDLIDLAWHRAGLRALQRTNPTDARIPQMVLRINQLQRGR